MPQYRIPVEVTIEMSDEDTFVELIFERGALDGDPALFQASWYTPEGLEEGK